MDRYPLAYRGTAAGREVSPVDLAQIFAGLARASRRCCAGTFAATADILARGGFTPAGAEYVPWSTLRPRLMAWAARVDPHSGERLEVELGIIDRAIRDLP